MDGQGLTRRGASERSPWTNRHPGRTRSELSGLRPIKMMMTAGYERIWETIEKVGICMLTSRTARGDFRARPVAARPDRANECLYFLTDARSAKEHEINVDPNIGLVVLDASAKAYVSLTARAAIFSDVEKAKELWTAADSMWWQGPEDPNLVIIRANLLTGEIWDGPALKAVEIFEFLKFRLTGSEPNLGENRKVTVQFGDQAPS
jgi:general stress protein 26